MTLGLPTQSTTREDIIPVIRYMVLEGRLYKRDRVQNDDGDGYKNEDVELPVGTKMVFDFGSIQVGWMKFTAGLAPSFAVVPLGNPTPQRPDENHQLGFKMLVHLGKNGGIRELSASSMTLRDAVDTLHTTYEAAPEAADGRIPIVEYTGATRTTFERKPHPAQTIFLPNFKIVGWVSRSPDLGDRTVPAPGGHAASGNGASRPAAPAAAAPARPAVSQPARQSVQQRAAQLPQQPVGGGIGGVDDDDLNDTIPFGPCWQ